ncbi:folate-binding protein [Rhodobacterales bacterium HKCCE3408]|nr:folate-binding protein [Rhodobacterales bacterium HKCCE3408]
MTGERAEGRAIIAIGGAERGKFLKGLVTNDVKPVGQGLSYSALLTPQGKFLADFFLLDRGDDILIDTSEMFAAGLMQRLAMYKLRADVTIGLEDISVARGLGPAPEGAFEDPRHPELGWRAYGVEGSEPEIDWDAIRVAHAIPESGVELLPEETYILEAGFDRLHGVDHRKGCYVGQEVTARMKHKTELRKGYVTVGIEGEAPIGTPVRDGDRAVGMLFTQAAGHAIAFLRFDRASPVMSAGDATIHWQAA